MGKFTEELRDAAGEQWSRVVNHRFTDELATGTIDRDVLKRYLIQDHRFLDVGVVLLASMVANARELSDRIPGCQFLAVLTGKENTYFERCFEKMNVTKEDRESIPDSDVTVKFCEFLRDAAKSGSLGEMLAVLVVCEWSYMSWGERVLEKTVRDDFACYEWVDLHSGEFFRGVIEYLRGLLDKEEQFLDEEGKAAVKKRFLEAVQYEEEFFEHAYLG